ncbi:hypothetical protein K2P97_04185 [bacterium]|nr:hypothetical protein [bacterium]
MSNIKQTVQQIINAVKDTMLSYTPARSQLEGIIKYDFKIGDARTNLMQLCFSNIAMWPLIFIIATIAFDPFKNSWSLVQLLSFENPIVLFLLDGRLTAMITFFVIFFVLEWLIRKEYILIALVFYFLNRQELHINLATIAILAIYLSRISYLWWLSADVESETKKIWKAVSVLQFVAWIVSSVFILNALDYAQINYLFNQGSSLNRYDFLWFAIILHMACSHLFLCFWGHFYFKKTVEPSYLPTYFSTANWILRFNMSYYLQKLLKTQINSQIEKHTQSQKQFDELKIASPGLVKLSVESVLKKETGFLKEAGLRLSKI